MTYKESCKETGFLTSSIMHLHCGKDQKRSTEQDSKPQIYLQVLSAVKELPGWEPEGLDSPEAIYEAVSSNAELNSIIARLSGAVQDLQVKVDRYMETFEPFSFLWLKDLSHEYSAFLATKPELEVGEITLVCRCHPLQICKADPDSFER